MKIKSMRIAILSIHSSPIGDLGTKDTGGMSVYTREVAYELGCRGHHVDIYTHRAEPGDTRVKDLHENVRLIHLSGENGGIGKKSGLKTKLELYPLLKDFFVELDNYKIKENLRYDLVHSHYWLSGELGRLAQHQWEVPHVIKFHTLGAVKNTTGVGEEEPRLRINAEGELVNACQRILAATDLEKDQLIRYYGASSDRIGVVSCGVNLELFQPEDKIEARKRLGFNPRESIVLYVGRFDPVKGIDRLLEAMTFLAKHYRIRLIIVGGDGCHTSEAIRLKKLSHRLGVRDAVTFVGRVRQNELPPYYSAADVVVVPSHYESFGLVGLESLACGTPLVATPVGGMKKIIRDGESGRVVDDASPVSMAKAIEMFINGHNDRTLPPDAIRRSVLEYSWKNVTSLIIDEYATLLKQ